MLGKRLCFFGITFGRKELIFKEAIYFLSTKSKPATGDWLLATVLIFEKN